MYTDKRNILQLAALLLAHGIRKVVLCPGVSNLPLTQTFANVPGFTCFPMTDERSAAFFALGLAIRDGTPAAVCCSSGAAALGLGPALAEACRQHVPLVAVTAGIQDRRTPEEAAPGAYIKRVVTLPDVRTDEDEILCNRLINSALLELNHHGKGPVQINVTVSEPYLLLPVKELPEVRVMRRYVGLSVYDQDYRPLIERLNRYQRRMVIAGQMNLIYLFDKRYTKLLYKHFVWVAENIGNRTVPGQPIKNIDPLLTSMTAEEQEKMRPDIVITYGGRIVSDRLKRFLRKHPPREHWHISPDGDTDDMFGALTTAIEIDPFEFLEKIAPLMDNRTPDYPRQWEMRSKALPHADFRWSQMSAIGSVIRSLPSPCTLHLAGGSAVRYSQFFDVPHDVEVISCSGTGGADGSLAAAMGYAAMSDNLNFVITGDLSFFCGINALWCQNYGGNVRILLLNNGGGGAFLAQPGFTPDAAALRFVTASHHATAQACATDRGFTYLPVHNEEEMQAALPAFTAPSSGSAPVLIEAFTDKEQDVEILKGYFRTLKGK